ncbi:alpha-1,6-mannosylglycoprotein 6-beta-n-acetylglucosaminyltransferase a [Plakobranchus ocellatus]|uniref:alpha-1,6-mannosyl-glycoprotein 6-beta-N-acetylglucosaminyltransferase n=1 Tax=Plakobranchus ocellatus TaxID=259542 RepID=A0AAV4B0K4_9GAST|nr:alpha-1,6-mannosylglycoprotein 6-beta-n-acetylglucosaminyltransferase a [Plakobranchus ocellatus]
MWRSDCLPGRAVGYQFKGRGSNPSPGQAEIIQLSEEYIRRLASENGDAVDGPYAGRFTMSDFKKTIAVLLESMLTRISRLETVINGSLFYNQTAGAANSISHHPAGLASRAAGAAAAASGDGLQRVDAAHDERCQLSGEDKEQYPACQPKIDWMRKLWKSDPCYKGYGVDGSDCSIIRYLSEVEDFCPRKSWSGAQNTTLVDSRVTYTDITLDLQPLMDILVDPNERQGYAWIRMRISRMWPQWTEAARNLMTRNSFHNRPKQKILVHLGLLSKQSGWKFAEMQFKGGPLGELVQWSDLISTLYILGHELTITSEVEQLVEILNHVPAAKTPCQSRKELPVQLIYTDIMGLIQFRKRLKAGYAKFSCLFRVVDSFGTEPAYNHRAFAKQNKILTSWGGQDLNPQQFFTMFPHSPDNSFMGFVVDRILNDTETSFESKKDIALVYGKNDYMWAGKRSYLDAIHQYFEVHATVYREPEKALVNVPTYVINHGILSGVQLHQLLQRTKVFVGLGFPYEGPAPLEAIANGAVFLNPRFTPPHSSKNTKFFKGKPTQREITSQHPYAEVFVGKPYVFTISINNNSEVHQALHSIAQHNNFSSYVPYEYTEEGMLQRMNVFIENQQFCGKNDRKRGKWPPAESITPVLGEAGKSCKDACWDKQKICEPSYFAELNTVQAFAKFTQCNSHTKSSNIYFPAVETEEKQCTKQAETSLFSCVGSMLKLRRLCPCRDFIPGQTALCSSCAR